MKNTFVIKISDLLKNIWTSDVIEFAWVISNKIHWLTEEWISGEVHLQAMNDRTIFVTLRFIEATLEDISDVSLKPFLRDIYVDEFTAKYVTEFEDEEDIDREIFDEEFLIDKKSETIDLEDMVVQAIELEAPVTKLAPGEELKWSDDTEEREDRESLASEGISNWVNWS